MVGRVWKGVPQRVRGECWRILLGKAARPRHLVFFIAIYETFLRIQIQLDLCHLARSESDLTFGEKVPVP